MKYIWKEAEKASQNFIDKFPELDPIIIQLLYNRNLKDQKAIDEFLYPDYSQDIHDPFLFSQMEKACDIIYRTIEKKELITVYGDYDADGVSSSVILNDVLVSLGAKVNVYLPHREKEGYGLNNAAVEEINKTDSKLIITCDCGISNTEEVKLAKKLGIKVIITDHHTVPDDMPKADAIIHPNVEKENYPFKFLAGGGVAFKLAQGLIAHSKNELTGKDKEVQEKWLLDMVAISTVADMVPLLGENRTLLKYGLIVLKKTKRLGLQKMLQLAALDPAKLDARTIGFTIAPRINAAGRMDHANLAYYLITETDEDKAMKYAQELNESNLARQKLTEATVKQAKEQDYSLDDNMLFFYQSDWSAGLTGLVASRLVRLYSRPCFVMTDSNDGIVGSGRSINGFNITEALQNNEDLLLRFGGHPQACGFSIEKNKLEEFKKAIGKEADKKLSGVTFSNDFDIEMKLDFLAINWELVDLVEKFKPYGHKNPEPLFVSENLIVLAAKKVGSNEKHWKLSLAKDDKKISAIAFGLGDIDLAIGDKINVAYNLSINQWNGNREIQLMIKDIKKDEL